MFCSNCGKETKNGRMISLKSNDKEWGAYLCSPKCGEEWLEKLWSLKM